MRMIQPKYSFTFSLKLLLSTEETKTTKLNPVLTQLNIEDSSQLDEFLSDFFSQFDDLLLKDVPLLKNSDKEELKSIIYLILWKHEHRFSSLLIKPFSLEYFLKKFNLEKFYSIPSFSKKNKRKKLFLFYIFTLISFFWSSHLGFHYDFSSFSSLKRSISGTLFSYLNRSEMKGRKTNFRRKVQKKKFEDY